MDSEPEVETREGRWVTYPQTRFLSYDEIYSYAADAAADGEFDPNEFECQSVQEMAFEDVVSVLEDIGWFTFASQSSKVSQLREQAHNEALELQAEREP